MKVRHSQFIKYGIIGIVTTGLELVILFMLTEHRHWWYLYSSIIAYAIGFCLSFISRKLWAFKDYNFKKIVKQFGYYSLILLITVIINSAALLYLVERWHFHYLPAQFLAGLAIGWIGFFVNEKITFSKKE